MGRTGHQNDLGPTLLRHGRQGESGLARRAIRDMPNRINRFLRRPGRDDDHAPGKIRLHVHVLDQRPDQRLGRQRPPQFIHSVLLGPIRLVKNDHTGLRQPLHMVLHKGMSIRARLSRIGQ
jgi:hypothetical protein